MAPVRVPVTGDVLEWAAQRSGIGIDRLYRLFPNWDVWMEGAKHPTMKQVEDIARATHTPVGLFFLSVPTTLKVPISDFRRMAGERRGEPSPDLLDVIHASQLRQAWYREHVRGDGAAPLPFVRSVTIDDNVMEVAASVRDALGIDTEGRGNIQTFPEMLRVLREKIEETGTLVFVSGIVGSNTRRILDPAEFRGFTLSDDYAPVVFVNGADTKGAQIFTLIHEYAHVWLGITGVSGVEAMPAEIPTERWCNSVAAEVLVPMEELHRQRQPLEDLQAEIGRLARFFKVSSLVILRRLFDAGWLDRTTYRNAYDAEFAQLLEMEPRQSSSGGDFYSTTLVRTGHRFARAVLGSAWEGRTSFTEAMRMLGVKSMDTLRSMSRRLAVYG